MISRIEEIYAYREMIFSLVKRDLKGRYKGSVLGFLWTFLNPLFQLAVYTMVFSTIMRSGIEDYYLFLFQYISDWRRILYFVSAGYGQENLFSEGSAANFICYKSVCKYAAEFYCHFCGFDCFAVHFKSSCDALPAGNYGSGVYIGAGICYGNERSYGLYTGCRICDRYCGDGMAVFNACYVFD